jgi:hypothetical protein
MHLFREMIAYDQKLTRKDCYFFDIIIKKVLETKL